MKWIGSELMDKGWQELAVIGLVCYISLIAIFLINGIDFWWSLRFASVIMWCFAALNCIVLAIEVR